MPLIEITVARDTLNKDEQLRMAKAVQKVMIKEFEEMMELIKKYPVKPQVYNVPNPPYRLPDNFII